MTAINTPVTANMLRVGSLPDGAVPVCARLERGLDFFMTEFLATWAIMRLKNILGI
jgi:hypothetical protein